MDERRNITHIELNPTQTGTMWALQIAESMARELDPAGIGGRDAELACREIRAFAMTHLTPIPGKSVAEMAALILEAKGGSWEAALFALALAAIQKPLIVEPSAVAINEEACDLHGSLFLKSETPGEEIPATLEATGERLALQNMCAIAKVFDAAEGHQPGGSVVVILALGPDAGRKVRVPASSLWLHWQSREEMLRTGKAELHKQQLFPQEAF